LFIKYAGGGVKIFDKILQNTTVKFENKWRKAPRKFSRILFKGENTPFDDEGKLFLLPRTPDFYLC